MKIIEWCWRNPTTRVEIGPFESREACIEDCQKTLGQHNLTVVIGHVREVSPLPYVVMDVDDVLTQMDERVRDDYYFDYDVFYIDEEDMEKAQLELNTLLREWAAKYVHSGGRIMDENSEEFVTLKSEKHAFLKLVQ